MFCCNSDSVCSRCLLSQCTRTKGNIDWKLVALNEGLVDNCHTIAVLHLSLLFSETWPDLVHITGTDQQLQPRKYHIGKAMTHHLFSEAYFHEIILSQNFQIQMLPCISETPTNTKNTTQRTETHDRDSPRSKSVSVLIKFLETP